MAPENEARTVPGELVTVKPDRIVDALIFKKYLLVYLTPVDTLKKLSELHTHAASGVAVNATPHLPYAVTLSCVSNRDV
ncbi:MAG: hypothetical protein WCH04_16530 [Gammaproteobacteria bacterium]